MSVVKSAIRVTNCPVLPGAEGDSDRSNAIKPYVPGTGLNPAHIIS